MTDFFRFPQTPHLTWLGEGQPRDDKVLTAQDVDELLSAELVVEEKIDGANLGISTTEEGELRCQNRGSYLERGQTHKQFQPLWSWLAVHEQDLVDALWPDLMLFGEWCVAVHSIEYDRLPDWFLGFDIYDLSVDRFWDTSRRDELLASLGMHPVPRIAHGRFSIDQIEQLLAHRSRVGDELVEGVVMRCEADGLTTARAKLVRAAFTQTIEEHWSRKPLRRNALMAERPT